MKSADRSGARFALLLGDDERAEGTVTIRSLRDEAEQRSVARADLLDCPVEGPELRKLLS